MLVASGFWRPEIAARRRLRFIQVPAVGYEQFDLDDLRPAAIHLANGSGVNKNAVSEHAMSLILSFTRHLHLARDNQHKHHWRGMLGDIAAREEELGGKTLVIYGLGDIGSRMARLARAFDMHVIGIKRDTANHDGSADEVLPDRSFPTPAPRRDFCRLACPLTVKTTGLVGAEALAALPRMHG